MGFASFASVTPAWTDPNWFGLPRPHPVQLNQRAYLLCQRMALQPWYHLHFAAFVPLLWPHGLLPSNGYACLSTEMYRLRLALRRAGCPWRIESSKRTDDKWAAFQYRLLAGPSPADGPLLGLRQMECQNGN